MQRSFEAILIADKLVSAEQLTQVKQYADTVGIDLHEAVLQRKIADAKAVMIAYCESIALPFIEGADITVDEDVLRRIEVSFVRHYGVLPFSTDGGFVHAAAAKPLIPDAEEYLRAAFNLPVKCYVALPSEVSAAISQYCPKVSATAAAAKVRQVAPSSPLTAEEQRNRLLYSIIAFNFTVFIVCYTLYFLHIPRSTVYQFPTLAFFGLFAGSVAAFTAWKVCSVHRDES